MKKKVLFMIDSLNGGGAEKILLDIVNNLDKDKYEIDIMTVWNRGKYVGSTPKNVGYKTIFKQPATSVFQKVIHRMLEFCLYKLNGKMLHNLFQKKKYDVEVAFLEGVSTKIVSGAPCKKIAWVHTDMEANTWYKQFYRSDEEIVKTYSKFDRICHVSEEIGTIFRKKFKVNDNNIVIYNPIDDECIKRKSLSQPVTNLSRSALTMVTVGRVEEQKGYDRLVRIAARLKEDGYNFQIYVLGEGSLRKGLESQCKELKVEDRVHFLGYVDNPYAVVKQADLFVCSSLSEGYHVAIAESLVLGVPVVSTKCGGINEQLCDNKYGIMCENCEKVLYEAIKRLLEKPEELEYWRKQAKIRGKTYSMRRSMESIEELLDE